jgi:glycosyltransferase involved in cell wall biosynthesis/thioredoxin-like negative regulator of GroEL
MIVKDEEANLPACLESAADLFDEIIVVDTGSADRTREVAARAGAKVVDFPWRDDFAAARNAALEHAMGEWVFWLDADDRIDAENQGALRTLFSELGDENVAYLMKCICLPDAATGAVSVLYHPRLFRNLSDIRWQYRVHEQILAAVQRFGGTLKWTGVVLRHVGYQDPARRRRKLERNLRLCELDAAEHPDDAFVRYNLGKTYLDLGRPDLAGPQLQRALQTVRHDDAIAPSVFQWLAAALHQLGQRQAALDVCRAGQARFPTQAELFFREALVLCEAGQFGLAEPILRRLLEQPPPPNPVGTESAGIRGHLARHNLALLCFHQKRFAEAEAHWHAALTERPDFSAAWFGLSDLWVAQGRLDELERTAERLAADPARATEAALLRGRARMAAQDFTGTRRVLEQAVRDAPQAVAPRLLLAHALVQEGQDWAALEQVSRDILTLVPSHGQARELLARARREQAQARPPADARQRVSLTMIVKDEETRLGESLASAAGLFDEIIVVDTGSKDRTRQIAAAAGAKVVDFPWCDDFAAARNAALEHARSQWVFWLDADERLDEENRRRLRNLFASLKDDNVAYLMKCVCAADNATGGTSEVAHPRLFRNRPDVRWQYRVHEQILPAVERTGGSIQSAEIQIQHAGYRDRAAEVRKQERNLRLLRLQDSEHPDDALTLFNIGWTLLCLGRPADALPHLQRSLERFAPDNSVVRKLYALLVQVHRALRRTEAGVSVCSRGLERYPDDPELLFLRALLLLDRKDLAGSEQVLRRLLGPLGRNYVAMGVREGLRGWQARDLLGQVCRDQGRPDEAEALWRQVVADRPDNMRTWLRLADLYAAQKRWDAMEAMARLLEGQHGRPADAALVRSRVHLGHKEFAAARQLAEEAVRQTPGSLWPREVLSQVLLTEGKDLPAAEQALRDVLALDPGNALARQRLVAFLAQTGRATELAARPAAPSPPWCVVLVQPPDYQHAAAFAEIAKLLFESLRSLGLPVTQTVNKLQAGAVNVVLGYHLLAGWDVQGPGPTIFYQLEQLPGADLATLARRVEVLRRGAAVWDYSPENLSVLSENGLKNVHLVPPGYHEALRTIPSVLEAEKDVGVLFYGSLNDRRRAVLERLSSECAVKHLFGVYGEERDRWIARSRVILNMHYYPAQISEQVRISYLLNNGCFVVSEESAHNPFEGCLVSAPYEKLTECCLHYVGRPDERERIAIEGLARFSQRPMVDYLRPVLEAMAAYGQGIGPRKVTA